MAYKKFDLGSYQEGEISSVKQEYRDKGYKDLFTKVLPNGRVALTGSLWEDSKPVKGYKFCIMGDGEVLAAYDTLDEAKDHMMDYETAHDISGLRVKKMKESEVPS